MNATFAEARGPDALRQTQSTLNPILPGAFKPQNETFAKAKRQLIDRPSDPVFEKNLESQLKGRALGDVGPGEYEPGGGDF